MIYYENASRLQDDVSKLDMNIDSLGQENIINNSKIDEIQEKINEIESKIKKTKFENFKRKSIKNIKIFGRLLQGIYPYVLIAGFVFGLQVAIYDVPFYRQDQYKIAEHHEVYDSNGLIYDDVIYIPQSALHNISNSAYYSTEWEKREDGKYYRTVKSFSVGSFSIDQLKEAVSDPEADFAKLYGSSNTNYQVKTEDEITENELKEGKGFKIVYRYLDDEEFILEIQNVDQNITQSVLYSVFTIMFCAGFAALRHTELDYDLMSYIYDIKRDYHYINIDAAIKLFEKSKVRFQRVNNSQVIYESPNVRDAKVYLKE